MSREEEKNIDVTSGIRKNTDSTEVTPRGWCVPWDEIASLNWNLVTHLCTQNKGQSGCYVNKERVTLVGADEEQICNCISMCGEKLQFLDLSYSALREVPKDIRKLTSLHYLGLDGLHLEDLPDWLPEIAEEFTTHLCAAGKGKDKAVVSLCNTTVESIPDMSIFDQPYEVIAEWFKRRNSRRTDPLNEIKVVFLGDGEAGKSHIIARLMNDGGEPVSSLFDGQSTPGIMIQNKEYDLGERQILVHYWDFGGQEIMHSMHRIFLTGRAMYVIVLNVRDDTQGDRAKYWLHNVKSFAPDAPVLLVLNKIDQNENASVDERDLRGRYDKLTQVVRLSALRFSQEEFNDSLTSVLLAEIQQTGYLDAQWPASWTRVKRILENMDSHYILGDDYQAICEECQVADNQKNLLHWFNDLGVSFCCFGEDDYALEDYVILRPDWITNALYIILFNRLDGARNGLIPHKSIYQLLKNAHKDPGIRCTLRDARYTPGDIHYVLGIMRKFNLSFPDGADHEFIPMLCQQNSKVDIQYYQKDADTLEFNMEFDYLPNNLLHRLMVERHTELDMENVWRTGALFQFKELGYSAVVVIDGNILRFFIRHSDPMHRPNTYLTMLKAHVDRIVAKMGLKPPSCQLIYKLDGKRDVFDFNVLRLRLEIGQTHELSISHRKLIPIADILNQSAPDDLEDAKKLLVAIRKACLAIQAEPDYYLRKGEDSRGPEDKRNRRIRDVLLTLGYRVSDQAQRGARGSGRAIGEADFLLLNERSDPWTIIEALSIGTSMRLWDQHLTKLLLRYNVHGLSPLFLISYVECDAKEWPNLWRRFSEHMRYYSPDRCELSVGSYEELNDVPNQSPYLRVAKCDYRYGRETTTVYHVFVKVGAVQ